MRRNDRSETSGPAREAADDAELKLLLDALAHQIADAEELHTETVENMQVRLESLRDRAAEAKPDLPAHGAETLERVQGAIVALADRLKETSPRRPSPAFDHWDPAPEHSALPYEAQEDVRRAITDAFRDTPAMPHTANRSPGTGHSPSSGARVTPAPDTGRDNPPVYRPQPEASYAQARPPIQPSARVEVAPQPPIDPIWLDARFADIAGRVERSLASINPHNAFLAVGARIDQLEQRFDSALNQLKSPAGTETGALKSVEKQIGDLFAQLDRTQTQLGRLEQIEQRISELRSSVSAEEMTRLIETLTPSDQVLSAVATAAAERVAAHIREESVNGPEAQPQPDPRLGELTTLMREFVREQRQGDAQTAEALDTMQLAMQHLIDRVEAIEAAQLETRDAVVRTAAMPSTPGRREAALQSSPPFALEPSASAAVADTAKEEAGVFVDGVRIVTPPAAAKPQNARPLEYRPDLPNDDMPDMSGLLLPEAHADAHEPTIRSGVRHDKPSTRSGEVDRNTMIAMARQAAHKASLAPAPSARPNPLENEHAKRDPRKPSTAAVEMLRRPGILLVASFVAFLLAGFWMVSGASLRSVLPSANAPAKTTTEGSAGQPNDRRSLPSTQRQGSLTTGTSAPSRPVPSDRAFPGMGRVVEGGIGIMIEEPRAPANPSTVLKVRDQIQMANLSARVGESHAVQQQPTEAQETQAASGEGSGPTPSVRHQGVGMVRSVELPPAMIGPLSLRHAAAKGDAAAQLEVASRFAEGKGVPQDFAQAATWYQRAATHGDSNAQYRLGALYERGLGVPADLARARVWYTRSAEQGNVRAMHNLAVLSAANRSGLGPDYPVAVQWFSEAASRGLADSQYNLGILYESGLGVPVNSVEAYKWYSLAARTGDQEATKRRDAVRGKLDRASLQAADALVIQWRAKPGEPIGR